MPPRRRLMSFLAVPALVALWLGCSTNSATSSDAGADCHTAPSTCKLGTTCWPISNDNGSPVFGCIASVPGAGFHAPCEDKVGVASCSDGMTCDATTQDGNGTCTFFCEDSQGCPANYSCVAVQVGAGTDPPTLKICRADNVQPVTDGGGPTLDGSDIPPGDAMEDVPDGFVVHPK